METERLKLRRFMQTDLNDVHRYLSKETVVKYEPYNPLTISESTEFVGKMSLSEDFWAVELLETGQVIGQVYLSKQHQDNWEVGYVFNDEFSKHGYATEAVGALISDLFENDKAHRISAHCNPENSNSWRLLERLDFRREGHFLQNIYFNKDKNGHPIWQNTFQYALLKSEWLNASY